MARLDQERQKKETPKRMEFARQEIERLGYKVEEGIEKLMFFHKNKLIYFYPYSGWATGKSIKDGRGLNNLLKQLKDEN